MSNFTPIRDYTNVEHVLSLTTFVHPNGNIYDAVVEKINGIHQDLAIYKLAIGSNNWVEIKRYRGGVDSSAQFASGSAIIGRSGNMVVSAVLIIPGQCPTDTCFQAAWLREFNIDQPW